MVHFLRRDDANDTSTVAAKDGLSRASYDYSPFSSFNMKNQQVFMDYMAENLPDLKMDGVYNKILSANACTGMNMNMNMPMKMNMNMDMSDMSSRCSGMDMSGMSMSSMNLNNQCANVNIAAMPGDLLSQFNDRCSNDNSSTFGEYSIAGSTFETSIDGTTSASAAGSGVRFGNIHLREYNRTVGDHPDCSEDGPPLAMDWAYVQLPPISVTKYEAKKKRRRKRRLERRHQRLLLEDPNAPFPKVSNIEFTVPRIRGPVRRELLHLEFNVPFQELVAAEQETKKVATQREESNTQSILAEKTQEIVESAQRKLKRSFLFGYGKHHAEISRTRSNGSMSSSSSSLARPHSPMPYTTAGGTITTAGSSGSGKHHHHQHHHQRKHPRVSASSSSSVSSSSPATAGPKIYDRRHSRRFKAAAASATESLSSNYYGGRRVPQPVY